MKIEIGRTTVVNILAEEGINPVLEREKKRTWKRFLKSHYDRDPWFTEGFVAILAAGGVKNVKMPLQSPNCNPHAERFVKTIKYECLNPFVIFGERHLRYLIKEFVEHHMAEQFHQGIVKLLL